MDVKVKVDLPFTSRECKRCKRQLGPHMFTKTSSPFFVKGYTDICNDCLKDYLVKYDFNWEKVDKLCQYLDIPFIPKEFERIREEHGDDCFARYAEFFQELDYEGLNWGDYCKEFKKLKEAGFLKDELPLLQDQHRRELQEKWGFNYDDEALFYLEGLYEGLLTTQNITGSLQIDQALKLCKISYELDMRIQGGATDIDKLIGSYEKLVKIAEFTPKNTKNAGDFDSVGELIKWLEKRGFVNQYYDNVTRDIVDETIKNVQAYNRRLYTHESDISEQINERINNLKTVEAENDFYNIDNEIDLDAFESKGFSIDLEDEEFEAEV